MTRGKWAILLIFAIGLSAASAALWYLRQQGRRALDFWGGEHAQRIMQSPRVEVALWPTTPDAGAQAWFDVSQARGLINLRRALLSDASFDWSAGTNADPRWEYLLRFTDESGKHTTLCISLSDARIAIVGPHRSVSMEPIANAMAAFMREQLLPRRE